MSKNKRIATSLMINYIIFIIILVLILFVTIVFSAVLISKNVTPNLDGTLPIGAEKSFYLILIKSGIFFFMLFIMSIIFFSLWTSKKFNKPLKNITEAMEQMVKGDYEVRIEFKAEKEFAVIKDTFNYMADKLKTTEQEKKELEQKKIKMLLNLSHDIKTPITTIIGFAKALSEDLIEEEDKKYRYYNTILNKATKVSKLTNDLFQIVKLESADYKFNLTKTDYVEFVRKIIAEHYEEIEEKQFELELIFPEKEINLEFDPMLMNRAITNIISNAIKHNPRKTKLWIEVEESSSEVVLNIGDNGIGVPEEVSKNIFDAFVTGDDSRKSSDGSGLGLSIAKMIVEKHGGQIFLKRGMEKYKTIFSVVLKK